MQQNTQGLAGPSQTWAFYASTWGGVHNTKLEISFSLSTVQLLQSERLPHAVFVMMVYTVTTPLCFFAATPAALA